MSAIIFIAAPEAAARPVSAEAPRPEGVRRGRLQMQPHTDRPHTKHHIPPTPIDAPSRLENF